MDLATCLGHGMQPSRFEELGTRDVYRKLQLAASLLQIFFEFISFKFWDTAKDCKNRKVNDFSENYLWCDSFINRSTQLPISSYRQSQHIDVRKGHFIG